MTRLLIRDSRSLLTSPGLSLPVVLTVLVLSNVLIAATLLGPDGVLYPPAGGNSGSILMLGWFAGNAIVAVWSACRLMIALCGQFQEWIGSAVFASMRWR